MKSLVHSQPWTSRPLDKVQGFRNLGSRLKAVTTEVDEKLRHRKMEKFLRDLVNATSPADSDCVVVKVERPAPGKHSAVGARIKTGDVFHYRHFSNIFAPYFTMFYIAYLRR